MIQKYLGKVISMVLLAVILVISYPYLTKLFKHMIAQYEFKDYFD